MTDKEQIIIDEKKEDCKILFRCKHIDDSAAYNMIRNGIKITPENAPIGDFELMLIENTDSPFGFSSVCKRNNKEDVWEYSGFGNSGACSIVTALLKQLTCKTQECEELKKELVTYKKLLNNPESIVALTDVRTGEREVWRKLGSKADRYRKALEEIEHKIIHDYSVGCDYSCDVCEYKEILDIINKAKGETNE